MDGDRCEEEVFDLGLDDVGKTGPFPEKSKNKKHSRINFCIRFHIFITNRVQNDVGAMFVGREVGRRG